MLLKPVLPVLDYILNYEYIAGELCVNRETTIIGCDGKCYLVKELAKASDAEKPLSSDKKHSTSETSDLFFAELPESNSIVYIDLISEESQFGYSDSYSIQETYSFFHPPISIS